MIYSEFCDILRCSAEITFEVHTPLFVRFLCSMPRFNGSKSKTQMRMHLRNLAWALTTASSTIFRQSSSEILQIYLEEASMVVNDLPLPATLRTLWRLACTMSRNNFLQSPSLFWTLEKLYLKEKINRSNHETWKWNVIWQSMQNLAYLHNTLQKLPAGNTTVKKWIKVKKVLIDYFD